MPAAAKIGVIFDLESRNESCLEDNKAPPPYPRSAKSRREAHALAATSIPPQGRPKQQSMNVPLVLRAFTELDIVQNPSERSVDHSLLRPHLQPRSLFGSRPRLLAKLNNAVPPLGCREADNRCRSLHLLIRPEGPADIVLFQNSNELRNPLVRIFPRLSKPHWNVIPIAKINVRLHSRLLRRSMVAVKRIHGVLVERRPEDGKSYCPTARLRRSERDAHPPVAQP